MTLILPGRLSDRRQADLMSVERHLVGWGHLEAADFEDFLQTGVLPVESR